jgi:ArsR family transcriptional regulator, zinc-responsive transcriptional repressor
MILICKLYPPIRERKCFIPLQVSTYIYVLMMTDEQTLIRTAELFKALSTPSRLRILRLLSDQPSSVSTLVEATRLSQPLVSQHLKTLRGNNLVTVTRTGKEALYALADDHVAHVIRDTIAHSREPHHGSQAD